MPALKVVRVGREMMISKEREPILGESLEVFAPIF